MLVGFEHVGMVVRDLDRTIGFYCDLLGLSLLLRKRSTDGRHEVAFLDAGNCQLEIFCPSDPVGPGTHTHGQPPVQAEMRHMTFAFTDIDAVYNRLLKAGITGLEPPRQAHNQEVFKRVAFVEDPDGIVVELAERAAVTRRS